MINIDNVEILNNIVNNKEEVFEIIAQKASDLGVTTSKEETLQGLKDRENLGTTGFTDGFAIPHCRVSANKVPTVLFFKANKPIEWDSLDGKPITEIFSLIIPEEGGDEHLKLLSKISRKLMDEDFRNNIKESKTQEEVFDIIKEIK